MLLKVDCRPIAVGKQPSIPLIYLGRKWTLNWWWWCGGFNNNPSVEQFKAAFQSLVLKNCISTALNAFCVLLVKHISMQSSNENFVGSCLYYICGSVIWTVTNSLSGEDCFSALHECILDAPDQIFCRLVTRKDKAGLKHCSNSVYKICFSHWNCWE